jgi:hypothetical protein
METITLKSSYENENSTSKHSLKSILRKTAIAGTLALSLSSFENFYKLQKSIPDPQQKQLIQNFSNNQKGQIISKNWAGYAITTSDSVINEISASWNVVGIKSSLLYSSYSQWIGIGGMNSDDLIQAGISQNSILFNKSMYLFYEILPYPEVKVDGFKVSSNDNIIASIKAISNDKHSWEIKIINTTKKEEFKKIIKYKSNANSGEWIVENGNLGDDNNMINFTVDLADFNYTEFQNPKIKIDKTIIHPSPLNSLKLTMANDDYSRITAFPTSLKKNSKFGVNFTGKEEEARNNAKVMAVSGMLLLSALLYGAVRTKDN